MIYTWRCSACGTEVEVERKLSEIDCPPNCADCTAAGHPPHEVSCCGDGCTEWTRVVSKNSFALSGNCWAKDGYEK